MTSDLLANLQAEYGHKFKVSPFPKETGEVMEVIFSLSVDEYDLRAVAHDTPWAYSDSKIGNAMAQAAYHRVDSE